MQSGSCRRGCLLQKGREVRQEQLEQVSQHPIEMTNKVISNNHKGRLPATVATELPLLSEFVIHGKNKVRIGKASPAYSSMLSFSVSSDAVFEIET